MPDVIKSLPSTAFVAVAATTPGQPVTQAVANLTPTLAPDPNALAPAAVNAITATIIDTLASDKAANTAGNTQGTGLNFSVVDQTVNVSLIIAGDVFKGTTAGIQFQFLDLTPDNLLIAGLTPNLFIKTANGNDTISVTGGRNIVSADSGINTMVAASGKDTFLSTVTPGANTVASVINFKSGDDVAITGLTLTDFSFVLKDTINGLALEANPTATAFAAGKTGFAEFLLQGYTSSDLGSKLTIGASSTPDGNPFVFLHAN